MTDLAATPVYPYPQRRECPYHPPKDLMAVRSNGPVHRITLPFGEPAWLVSSYLEGRQLLADPRLSADRTKPGFPLMSAQIRTKATQKLILIGYDPPAHDEQRRIVNPEFSLKQVRARRPEIQEIVDSVIDDLLAAGPPADLVPSFSVPIPSMVISRLLGIPYEDHDFFQSAARRMILLAETPEQTEKAAAELFQYLDGLIGGASGKPVGGLLGRLTETELSRGTLTRQQIVQLGLVILVAGHETTSEMISLGTVALLDNPEQVAKMRANPDILPAAVEELLRFLSVTETAGLRVATEDIEVGDVVIRAGEGVIVSNGLANRDALVHLDPDVLDIERTTYRNHLAFGHGIHQCLGQSLARLELEVVFATLFNRIPTLRLGVPSSELPIRRPGVVQGVESLPVTW